MSSKKLHTQKSRHRLNANVGNPTAISPHKGKSGRTGTMHSKKTPSKQNFEFHVKRKLMPNGKYGEIE